MTWVRFKCGIGLEKEVLCNLPPERLSEFLRRKLQMMIMERTFGPHYNEDLEQRLPDHIVSKWNADEHRFEFKRVNSSPTHFGDYDCTSQILQEKIWDRKLERAYRAFGPDQEKGANGL